MDIPKVVIIKKGIIVYRGLLPNQWRHHCGLHHSADNWPTLNAKGIFELIEVMPEDVPVAHKIDGFTDKFVDNTNIQTWNIRAKTQDELDAEVARILANERHQKIEDEKEKLAVESLIGKGELPADYI